MNKGKILITGCSGFLGGYLLKEYSKEDNVEIFGITEIKDFCSVDMEVINIDIRDGEKLDGIVRKIKPEAVFHFAAISNVGFSWKNPALTYDVNFLGSSNLLESLRKYSPNAKILLMSSAEVYKSENVNFINENSPIDISNPYALSKYAMEILGKLYEKNYGMNVLTVRSFNFTGPGQNRSFVISDFSYQIAAIEKGIRPPEIKVGNLSARRDFSDVRDIARYLRIIMGKGDPGKIYNICSGSDYSIEELLNFLLEMSEVKIKIEVDKERFRLSDSPILSCDNTLIRNRFNLHPQFKIKQTLKDILAFWRKRI